MRLGELGGYIQETMESYEVEVGGKTLPGFSTVLLLSTRADESQHPSKGD